jgi:2-polyprenyl-3-methyl-5-hydroxy-6-metoxy-1,4-benzoquinol methylase
MQVPADGKNGRENPFSKLFWCESCQFGTLQPVPSEAEVAKFYQLDTYYTQGQTHFEDGEPLSFLDRVRQHLAWRLDRGRPLDAQVIHELLGKRAARICDIGCGSGYLLGELVKLGHSVMGVEVDPAAVSRNNPTVTVFAGTAEALPDEVRRERFDLVVLSHVLEHCRDPLAALQNARSVLAEGGLLVCEVPNNEASAFIQQGCSWEMFDVPRHLHFFTRRSLTRAIEKANMRVASVDYGHYYRQFTNSWIATERKLWRNLMQGASRPSPEPQLNSRLRAWWLLAATMVAPREQKYDSVMVIATLA